MHNNGKRLFEKYAVPLILPGFSVLEIGPSRHNPVLRDLLPGTFYHYADIRNFDIGPGRIHMPKGDKIDAPDRTFDVVFSAQVIEHVDRPWRWVPELARVAKRMLILIGPVSYSYHPGPIDCWRIFADGMRILLADAGLRVRLAVHETDGIQTDTIGIGEQL